MTITDAGPLVAMVNKRDDHHALCLVAARAVQMPLLTTLPVFTETMYLLGDRLGWHGQETLWRLVEQGTLTVDCQDAEQRRAMGTLMRRYRDTPMDLADASLVALAEAKGQETIFTLDSHFQAYRMANRRVFRLVPEPPARA